MTFTSPVGPLVWAWDTCRRWPGIDAAMDQAHPYIERVVDAWRNRDAGWLIAAAKPKHHDMARAFPNRTLAAIEAVVVEDITTQLPITTLRPIAASRLCADGRWLLLLDPAGEDLLQGRDEDGPFGWSAAIGRRDDGWAIIR
ncbi:hypothetical protein LWE61_09015 [Sphingobium sufflavum]|uniref:hypothetical protein n=1 Tax=Sphingobium sufflavum TaxID=1129547 RepID=UPI001F468E92|nr:hypothetical protein [Sphingobium sufflavum]MCE7796699.1 hypothetical protein [Sphingobium sufflavum]